MSLDNPQQAAEQRAQLSRALREAIDETRKAGLARAEAEALCDEAYSKALLKSTQKSAEQRKAEAYTETARLQRELLVKQIEESYWRNRTRGIESDISAFMTVVAALRSEWDEEMRAPVGAGA